MRTTAAWFVLPLFAAALAAQPHKELGRMWTFEHMPLEWFKTAYDFEPTAEWVEKVRLSALRFGNGCSASFVSPRGLIMTNHHCARGNVAQVSPKDQDWLGDGFFAATAADEVKIPDLVVRQLIAMRDINTAMNAGVDAIVDAGARQARLDENKAKIIADAKTAAADLEHQVVALYQGGTYQLYSYKVFNDIRLVGTPHLGSAKFGGDPDNFTYPRFSLDYAFVRAWENDRPADTSKHYYKWKTEGPKENDTVFIVGNPGSTGRLKSIAQMEYLRDMQYPALVARFKTQLASLYKRSNDDPERAKSLRTQILSLENSRKAVQGYLDGLRNEKVMAVKRVAEEKARDGIARHEALQAKLGNPWSELEQLVARKRAISAGGEKPTDEQVKAMQAHEATLEKRIGEAFYGLYGTAISPDATFTLRISDGVVKGFDCNGTIAPWFTSLYGLYARHTEFGGKDPFELPQPWLDRMGKLDLRTPFNLVSTCDIIGGNSGSPMINTNAEVVGLVFDGNIEMLANNFVFTDEVARSVSVHPAIIIASLRHVYNAKRLADELEAKGATIR